MAEQVPCPTVGRNCGDGDRGPRVGGAATCVRNCHPRGETVVQCAAAGGCRPTRAHQYQAPSIMMQLFRQQRARGEHLNFRMSLCCHKSPQSNICCGTGLRVLRGSVADITGRRVHRGAPSLFNFRAAALGTAERVGQMSSHIALHVIWYGSGNTFDSCAPTDAAQFTPVIAGS